MTQRPPKALPAATATRVSKAVASELAHARPIYTGMCSAIPIPGHDSRPLFCAVCGRRLADGHGHWADDAPGLADEAAAPHVVVDRVPSGVGQPWGWKPGHVHLCRDCAQSPEQARARLARKRKLGAVGNFGPSERGNSKR